MRSQTTVTSANCAVSFARESGRLHLKHRRQRKSNRTAAEHNICLSQESDGPASLIRPHLLGSKSRS
jgi:hypothetical protein